MAHRHPIEELKHCEYLTLNEAARVFGRSAEYFRKHWLAGAFDGYTESTKRGSMTLEVVYLKTESVRAHFDSRCAERAPTLKEYLQQRGLA